MIPQQLKRGCWESPSLDMRLFSEASPSSVWKSAQHWRKRNDLAFKAFIWSSGAGSCEFPALGLASSVVCSVLLRGCLCCTMEPGAESPGAESRRSAWPHSTVGHCVEARPPSQKNTAVLVQALPCAAGALLLPVLELWWSWLNWASLYHTPLVNPGSTELLRN